MSEAEWEERPETPRSEIEAAAERLRQIPPPLDAYHRGVAAALGWLLGTGPVPFAERLTAPVTAPDDPGSRVRAGDAAAEVYYNARTDPEVRQYALGVDHVVNGVVGGVDELPPYRR